MMNPLPMQPMGADFSRGSLGRYSRERLRGMEDSILIPAVFGLQIHPGILS
jgi:hypothetical protein